MDLPAFYARRVSEYIGGLVAAKETYKFQDADSLSLSCTLTLTCIYGDDPVHTDKSQTFLEWDLMTRHVSHFTPPVS